MQYSRRTDHPREKNEVFFWTSVRTIFVLRQGQDANTIGVIYTQVEEIEMKAAAADDAAIRKVSIF